MRPWPRLNAVEGRLLVHLERLVGAVAGPVPPSPLRFTEPLRPAVAELGRRRMAAATLRFLYEGGGWRRRTVLRPTTPAGAAPERLTGRLWDAALNQGFSLRFSAGARAFWLASARHLPALTTAAQALESERGVRQRRRMVREILPAAAVIPAGAPPTGDWALFALLQQHLGALGLTDETTALLARQLRLGSPLALLLALDGGDAGEAALEERLRALLTPAAVRLVECCEDRLLASWTARLGDALRRLRGEADWIGAEWQAGDRLSQLVALWSGAGRALRAWLGALDGARRLDLARPLARLARALATDLVPDGGAALRTMVSGIRWLRSMQERDRVIAAIAEVVDLGPSLLRRRDQLAGERYGDPRYHEAQLFVRDLDDELVPRRDRVEGLARGLSGIIA